MAKVKYPGCAHADAATSVRTNTKRMVTRRTGAPAEGLCDVLSACGRVYLGISGFRRRNPMFGQEEALTQRQSEMATESSALPSLPGRSTTVCTPGYGTAMEPGSRKTTGALGSYFHAAERDGQKRWSPSESGAAKPMEQSGGKEGREHGWRVRGDRVTRTGQPTIHARCRRARELRRQRAIWRGKETATVKCQQNRSSRAESWVPRSLGTSGTCSLGAESAHGGEKGAFLWLQDRPPVVYWPWPGGQKGNRGSRADVSGGKPCCPSHLSITRDTT